MAPADDGGPAPDLYQLLGVSREASHQEIALAWRRRARDEHPDARPGDPGAPGRVRPLARGWPGVRGPGPPPAPALRPRPAPPGAGRSPDTGAAPPRLRPGGQHNAAGAGGRAAAAGRT